MRWPETIGMAIEVIEAIPSLTDTAPGHLV
jgi:hypothetical protein